MLQRQYFEEPSTYVDKYLCYRDNTLMNRQLTKTSICVTLTNHQFTWTSICVTETLLLRTINLRGQVFVLQRQYFDEPSTYEDKYLCNFDESSTYVDKFLCYKDNTLMNHQLTWTSICVTETIC